MRAVERTIVAVMPEADAPNPGNPIHSSDSARDYGFRAALVGGATIYGWCADAIIDAAGMQWLEHGWADVAFRRPVFPNDRLIISIGADGTFEVRGDDTRVRIDGHIGLGDAPWLAELTIPLHKREEPAADPLPRLTPQNVPVGKELRTRLVPLSRDDAEAFCRDKQNETLDVLLRRRCAHPSGLVRESADLLAASFVQLWSGDSHRKPHPASPRRTRRTELHHRGPLCGRVRAQRSPVHRQRRGDSQCCEYGDRNDPPYRDLPGCQVTVNSGELMKITSLFAACLALLLTGCGPHDTRAGISARRRRCARAHRLAVHRRQQGDRRSGAHAVSDSARGDDLVRAGGW